RNEPNLVPRLYADLPKAGEGAHRFVRRNRPKRARDPAEAIIAEGPGASLPRTDGGSEIGRSDRLAGRDVANRRQAGSDGSIPPLSTGLHRGRRLAGRGSGQKRRREAEGTSHRVSAAGCWRWP